MKKLNQSILWLELKLREERGAGLAEYALLLFVIAVAAAGIVGTFGENIVQAFTDASETLPSDGGGGDGGGG